MADNATTFKTLNELIKICHDGHYGFREAAEQVKDPELKRLFNELSLERSRFAGELEAEAERLGQGKAEKSGHAVASMHRAWIDLKANLGGGDHAILSSVEAGEDAAKKAYDEAVRANLPENILEIVRSQQARVLAAHDLVRTHRDKQAAA
jgi:uncharacterized protein (TIGR02284 family)